MITLTENAVSAVRRFIQSAEEPVAALRIKVDGGGCSGFQYGFTFDEFAAEDDAVARSPAAAAALPGMPSASSGSSASIGITAMSWLSRTEKLACPPSDFISPFS